MNLENYRQKIKSVMGLSLQLAKAEFKLRNEGSYLGIFWYLLNPLLTFLLLLLVFADRLGNNIPQYPLYLLLGVIMFNFFQSSTIESMTSVITGYKGIIKSINFPKESLVASVVFKNVFSHFFEILFFIIFLLIFKSPLAGVLYYLPIVIIFCFFVFGISLFLASLTVYFVDLENIWLFAIRLVWLGTPIFYAIEGQTKLYYVNLFNPMYYFITMARDLVIYAKTPDVSVIFGAVFSALFFFLSGLLVFDMLKNKFAEKI
jgi:ABC-type polysaccharide/polyol phosphate export permease